MHRRTLAFLALVIVAALAMHLTLPVYRAQSQEPADTVGESLDAVLADHEARISALEAAQSTPTSEPEPTPTETATAEPTPEPTATLVPTEEPTATPEPTQEPSPTVEPTITATPTPCECAMTFVPTFRSIGIYVAGVGGNQDVPMQWRVPGGDWHDGHPLMIDMETGEARGSLVGLEPNTTYEVRAAGETATVTTRDEFIPDGDGATIEVTTDAEFRAALVAVQAGETIQIAPGTYTGPFVITADGTASDYITITGEDAILTGNAGTVTDVLTLDNADYVRISGLTIRDARMNLVKVINGSDHAVIENNALIEPAYGMVTQPNDTSAALHFRQDSSYAVIRHNTFHRETAMTTKIGVPGVFNWTAGRGAIVYGNTFTGGFEDALRWAPEDTSSLSRSIDLDIYQNTIDGACYDDAIQPEGVGINVRIWENDITRCFIGIAFAPLIEGPVYVFRNSITELQHPTRGGSAAYKLGDEDPGRRGRKYFYHNTVVTGGPPGDVAGYKQTNSGLGGITSRNNILVVGRYIYEGGCDEWCTLDYDLLYTSDPSRFVEYRGPRSGSPESWCTNAGQACHSIEGLPEETNLEFGTLIPGFNDAASRWPSIGVPTVGRDEV